MKCLHLLIVFFTLVPLTIQSQSKVIERPDVENTNTEFVFINKLELNNNETVLHCDAYNTPGYWVMVPSGSYLKGKSGKKYKLLRSNGFELDKKVHMPESGTMAFTMHFEPLDSDDDTFDFIQGDDKDPSNISGVKTYKTMSSAPIKCLIKGEVIDRPKSNLLYLKKKGADARVNRIVIPIKNGKFEHELNCDGIEVYELTFKDEMMDGSWVPVPFFSENGTIEMKLYPYEEAYEKNIIKGGPLTKEYVEYGKKIEKVADNFFSRPDYSLNLDNLDNNAYTQELRTALSSENGKIIDSSADIRKKGSLLHKENRFLSEEAKELLRRGEELEDKDEDERNKVMQQFYKLQEEMKHMSPEAEALVKQSSVIEALIGDWEILYMKDNISLVSYEQLLHNMKLSLSTYPIYHSAYGKTGEYISLYNTIYSKKYPDHTYTKEMATIIDSHLSIKPGGKYIDFTAPDFEGNPVTLSQQIDGNVALIDLWASWCGPCRRLSKSMIPIYEEYKNHGFTIVGVAREEKAQNGINAAKKDNYPWLNLLELNDKNEIWKKYGVGNAGGSTFLVDKDGTILAVHPTAEEVRTILNEKIKK
ncbi:TlpA disulfide reductase family protein [Prevotella sp. 10(H)]|uniref:TlpA disulfide reductase family protein n=1 Tax=Prevotella sp. 10(H) TaxID=1158294 RepID=UPI00068F3861|nr:TlpA disulfide reductase family protein [Prevotella sp. 10(H)]